MNFKKIIAVFVLSTLIFSLTSAVDAAEQYAAKHMGIVFYVEDSSLAIDESFLRATIVARREATNEIFKTYTLWYGGTREGITYCDKRSVNPKHGAKLLREGTTDWFIYKKAADLCDAQNK